MVGLSRDVKRGRRVHVGGDLVYLDASGGPIGLSESQAAEIGRRTALVRAAKDAKHRREGVTHLEHHELEAILPDVGGPGFRWPDADPGRRVVTPEVVRRVRELRGAGHTNLDVSRRLGISRSHVSMIFNRRVWAEVE